tara:strand:- start:104 stop:244 length:141 start_codon:yes stop_codon:yes gene_type:complete
MKEHLFIFVFPLLRKPTDDEMESFREWIITFYELRHELSSFELAYA